MQLAIIVPTYNRAECLRVLLQTLERELAGLSARVSVLVSDNCSTDATPEVVQQFEGRIASLCHVRHPVNVGADENFCGCVERVEADYFWIIGDDDLPCAGMIARLLRLLEEQAPDLVNLRADWRPALVDNDPDSPVHSLDARVLDRLSFARRVNVWTTFISGVVIRRDTFTCQATGAALRRYAHTNLVQLSWVLGTLREGKVFVDLRAPCILATSGNTGGYKLLKVFGHNFAEIVDEMFCADRRMARAMIRRCILGFLPSMLWSFRFGHVGAFASENVGGAMRAKLGRYAAFPLLLLVGQAPRPVAAGALAVCKLLDRVLRVVDRMTSRLAGERRLSGY